MQPYASAEDNHLQAIASTCITAVLSLIVIAQTDALSDSEVTSLCICAVVCLLICLCGQQTIRVFRRFGLMFILKKRTQTKATRKNRTETNETQMLERNMSSRLSQMLDLNVSSRLFAVVYPDPAADDVNIDVLVDMYASCALRAPRLTTCLPRRRWKAGTASNSMIGNHLFRWLEEEIFAYPITDSQWARFVAMARNLLPHNEALGDVTRGLRLIEDVDDPGVGYIDTATSTFRFVNTAKREDFRVEVDEAGGVLRRADGTQVRFRATIFSAFQVLAHKISRMYTERTHALRDAALESASPEARQHLTGLDKKFGFVQQSYPFNAEDLLNNLVPASEMSRDSLQRAAMRFDRDVLVPQLTYSAENAHAHFQQALQTAFPEAKVIDTTELEDIPAHTIGRAIMVAPIKGAVRVREKVEEYAEEANGDMAEWPYSRRVGDMLRATVVCDDMDTFDGAYERLVSAFSLSDERGRLKNNLFTDETRPPDLLLNVVVQPPGYASVMGEVQVRASASRRRVAHLLANHVGSPPRDFANERGACHYWVGNRATLTAKQPMRRR